MLLQQRELGGIGTMAAARVDSSSSQAIDGHVPLLAPELQKRVLDRKLQMENAGARIFERHDSLLSNVWVRRIPQRSPDSVLLQTWMLRTTSANNSIRKPLHIPQPHPRET